MKDLAKRFPENPLLLPKDITPSAARLKIISLLNPGVFKFRGEIWLLVRVAEGLGEKEGVIYIPVLPPHNKDYAKRKELIEQQPKHNYLISVC